MVGGIFGGSMLRFCFAALLLTAASSPLMVQGENLLKVTSHTKTAGRTTVDACLQATCHQAACLLKVEMTPLDGMNGMDGWVCMRLQ